MLCAWDRVEAHAAARKLAAIAELARRNPAPEDAEFTADQLAYALGESRTRGYDLLGLADHLDTRLPGTRAALLDGTISLGKARLIATATALLDAGRGRRRRGQGAGPGGPADPGRAARRDRPRRDGGRPGEGEAAAGDRGEVRPGGAVGRGHRQRRPDGPRAAPGRGAGRGPADLLVGRELRKAGLDGGMDELRARAFLDLLLGKDSRPRRDGGGGTAEPSGSGPAGGFAGRVNLTVPLGTAAGLADRPGELAGLGPVDPWLARDLLRAAAANPKTTWCVTVTDQHGHAVGHGCARPEPRSHRKRAPGPAGPAGFSFTAGQPGRPARRIRHLDVAHPGRRAGPAGHPRPAHHARL